MPPHCPGSHGVHLEVSARNKRAIHFYKKLGFLVLKLDEQGQNLSDQSDRVLILGRSL